MEKKISLLIVDDESEIREFLIQIFFGEFHDEYGIECLEAANGKEALEVLSNNPQIQLIITDLNMPKMNGPKFIERVRDNDHLKDLPIFVLTAFPEYDLPKKYKNLVLFEKPFSVIDIIAKIRSLLNLPSSSSS